MNILTQYFLSFEKPEDCITSTSRGHTVEIVQFKLDQGASYKSVNVLRRQLVASHLQLLLADLHQVVERIHVARRRS